MAPSASWAVLARFPSDLRLRREAAEIRRELPEEASMKATTATSTIMASSGSRNTMTTTMTSRVKVLAAIGRPAVTATSCMRLTSAMSR